MRYHGKYMEGWDLLRQKRYDRQLLMGLARPQWKLSPRPVHVPVWDEPGQEDKKWEDFRMATYAAMVDRMDHNIGKLVEHLKKTNQLENTIIMFCSDNGACPFERTKRKEHDPWDSRSYWTYDVGWAHMGNTPFRLYKQNQHEGGISSPMIVHWPVGLKVKPGSFTDQPAHIIDFMATTIDLAGATYPKKYAGRDIQPLQGKSMVPIFEGRQRQGHDWLYFQYASNRTIRRGQWKLVSFRGGPWELYDIEKDPAELNGLSGNDPKCTQELSELWHKAARDVDLAPGKPIKKEPVKANFKNKAELLLEKRKTRSR